MKTLIGSLTLGCLLLAAVAAAAGTLYTNGPAQDGIDAWTINSGFVVSDTLPLPSGGTVTGLEFVTWMFPGDVLTSVEVSITSAEFGGTTYFDQVENVSQSQCVTNEFGFSVCNETSNFNGPNLAAGSYWLNLQNATVANGDPVYWDENSGPSMASESSLGTIPSETFTIFGNPSTGGTTPEPSNILLLGSGILGVAGAVRRKLR